MRLGEYHTITADGNGYSLTYEKLGEINPATQKPISTKKISYHANILQVFKAYINNVALFQLQDDLTTPNILLAKIEQAYKDIEDIVSNNTLTI